VSTKSKNNPRVYIPNRSYHDFKGATKYGELVFLTEGRLPNRYQLNDLALMCSQKMQGAGQDDMLLVSGPTTLNCIAAALLAHKFGRINFLIYDQKTDKYTQRTVVLEHSYAKVKRGE
jgi:hypothetical protein